MTDLSVTMVWTTIAKRTASGSQDWDEIPRPVITLAQMDIEVAGGRILSRIKSEGKSKVLQVRLK